MDAVYDKIEPTLPAKAVCDQREIAQPADADIEKRELALQSVDLSN